MAGTKDDLLYTEKDQVVNKVQLYGLLVDALNDLLLDGGGNAQAGEVHVDADGSIHTKLMGSKVKLKRVRELLTPQVNASSTSQYLLYASPGYIGRLKYIGASAPVIAGATGNHELYVTVGVDFGYSAERIAVISAVGTTSVAIDTAKNTVASANIIFDETTPLVITYNNLTNVNQTASRLVYILYEEEAITL